MQCNVEQNAELNMGLTWEQNLDREHNLRLSDTYWIEHRIEYRIEQRIKYRIEDKLEYKI